MPIVTDGGTSLWYQITGSGPPMVLTGGFGLLHNQWDFVRESLSRHFAVIDWNYRGAGLSDRAWPGGAFHQDRWVDDLHLILTHLDVRDAVLWATSTGSPIGVRYVARYPERVRALITYPMFKADAGFRQAFDGFRRIGETFGYEALAALTSWIGVSSQNLFTAEWGRLARWEAEYFRRNFSIEVLGATMAIVAGNDLTSDLARIKVPTLVLMGATGNLGYAAPGNRALADEFTARVPHSAIRIVPGGGTYCMIEEPEAAADAVIEWVRSIS